MKFDSISNIEDVEIIARGKSIREFSRLNKVYGKGRWRKLKGIAEITYEGITFKAEIHWYEAHGIGIKEFKIKTILED